VRKKIVRDRESQENMHRLRGLLGFSPTPSLLQEQEDIYLTDFEEFLEGQN